LDRATPPRHRAALGTQTPSATPIATIPAATYPGINSVGYQHELGALGRDQARPFVPRFLARVRPPRTDARSEVAVGTYVRGRRRLCRRATPESTQVSAGSVRKPLVPRCLCVDPDPFGRFTRPPLGCARRGAPQRVPPARRQGPSVHQGSAVTRCFRAGRISAGVTASPLRVFLRDPSRVFLG
jgi:hypothetical protein